MGLPLVICLNKTSNEEARILTQTLAERLQQESITYLGESRPPLPPWRARPTLADTPEAEALRRTVTAAIEQHTGTIPQARLAELLQHYWPAWSKPLQEEHSAAQQWATAIDNGIAEALGDLPARLPGALQLRRDLPARHRRAAAAAGDPRSGPGFKPRTPLPELAGTPVGEADPDRQGRRQRNWA